MTKYGSNWVLVGRYWEGIDHRGQVFGMMDLSTQVILHWMGYKYNVSVYVDICLYSCRY